MSDRLKANLAAAAMLAGALVLYTFAPEQYGFYPRCPLYRFAHMYCPGCGATRALAALLHGHLAQALNYNALVVVLVPFALAYLLHAYWSVMRNRKLSRPSIPVPVTAGLAGVAAVFTIVRNVVQTASLR
jgi:Protein of unknown function (DUF2752)